MPRAEHREKSSQSGSLVLRLSIEKTALTPTNTEELSIEKSPLCQLVLRLTALTPTNTDQPQANSTKTQEIRINQIISKHKENYISYWKIQTQTQSKRSCYLCNVRCKEPDADQDQVES